VNAGLNKLAQRTARWLLKQARVLSLPIGHKPRGEGRSKGAAANRQTGASHGDRGGPPSRHVAGHGEESCSEPKDFQAAFGFWVTRRCCAPWEPGLKKRLRRPRAALPLRPPLLARRNTPEPRLGSFSGAAASAGWRRSFVRMGFGYLTRTPHHTSRTKDTGWHP
jgi:hypothetical protein